MRQERLLAAEKLRQERGEKQNVLGVAGAQYKRTAKQGAKARRARYRWDFGSVGRLPRLLPALPGQIKQVRRAKHFQGAEQLFRR